MVRPGQATLSFLTCEASSRMMQKLLTGGRFVILLALILAPATVQANDEPLFNGSEMLQITISGNFSELTADDGVERDWHPFELQVNDNILDVKLRLRGNFRRKECTFPPITVNFNKKQVQGTVFEGQDKLKLVTHCRKWHSFSVNNYEEYVAYRLFNQITDKSFRVRLLSVSYEQAGKKPKLKPAFFIEDVGSMAKRLDGEHIEPDFIRSKELDPLHLTQAAIFQYLIGNTDFSFIAPLEGRSCCHNAKLVRIATNTYSIPYDFDFSGLVDAPYAGANPMVKSSNVRKRRYRGFCTDKQTLPAALDSFQTLEAELPNLFASVTGFDAKQSSRSTSYLQRFFTAASKSGSQVFESHCRNTRPG
ncbi:MAG: hypothetical protein ABGY96_08420 [bacterium]|nr:hypothetical protein [Gammaproteobacteria bacterium]HIL96380.1 hypothetical protein [Pseudomonadales bacterium]